MMLVDSHCHLDYDVFDDDRDDMMARAANAGVSHMLTICTEVNKFNQIREIAEKNPQIFCSLGCHPHHAADEIADLSVTRLVALAQGVEKLVGIGECGLDYYYEHSPREEQIAAFRCHIQAALELDLPLIIHTRAADDDTMQVLREEAERAGRRPRGVLHCFSGSRNLCEQALDFGMYISLSGIVTFKKAEELRAIVADVPVNRILVETDAPYLAPQSLRGQRCEPSFVTHTAAVVAGIKAMDLSDFARHTTDNFFTLFNRAQRNP